MRRVRRRVGDLRRVHQRTSRSIGRSHAGAEHVVVDLRLGIAHGALLLHRAGRHPGYDSACRQDRTVAVGRHSLRVVILARGGRRRGGLVLGRLLASSRRYHLEIFEV